MSNVSRFKLVLNLNQFLADLNRGSNSLNSISGLKYWNLVFQNCVTNQFSMILFTAVLPPPPPISLSFIYEPFPRFLTASTSWNSSSTLHISASDFLFSGSRFSRKVPENIREVCGIIDIEDRKSLSLIFMIF